IVAPSELVHALARVVKAVAHAKGVALPVDAQAALTGIDADQAATRIAASLSSGKSAGIFLGNLAQHHPALGQLHALTQILADLTGAKFGFFGEAANSVGGYIADALPQEGLNAQQMILQPRRAYVLL